MNAAHFGQLAELRAGIVRWCASLFERYDLLLTPTVPFDPYPPGPYPQETEGRPQPWSNVGSFTIPFNLSWHPAATVRVGLSRRGLPMGGRTSGRASATTSCCRWRAPSSASARGIPTWPER
ncbi:MAG: amidase family protein [Candidatus Binatia bacterium]